MEKNNLEVLKNLLGKKVKFYDSVANDNIVGTVIAVYLSGYGNKNELKISKPCLDEWNSKDFKHVYRKLSEVKEITTVTAYAYKDPSSGNYFWKAYEDDTINRVPSLDMTKEIP